MRLVRLLALAGLGWLPAAAGLAGAVVPGPPAQPRPPILQIAGADHVERAGRGEFDATGSVPCAHDRGQPMGQCAFGVARGDIGDATVVVTHPNGRKRTIVFEDGKAASADISQADGDIELHTRKEADLNLVRIGDERYEIPDAAILGG